MALLDEVDMLLNPLKSELNFPIGKKMPLDLSPLRWALPLHVLDAMFYVTTGRLSIQDFRLDESSLKVLSEIKAAVNEGIKSRALGVNPHIYLLQDDFYHDKLRQPFSEWCFVWLKSQACINVDREAAVRASCSGSASLRGACTSGISYTDLDSKLVAYIAGNTMDPSVKAVVNDYFSGESIKLLNLAKDWVCSFLPHCISKVGRVGFGLLQAADLDRFKMMEASTKKDAGDSEFQISESRSLLAVPFVGKDVPSKASEFAHPEVLIGLTILSYRYEVTITVPLQHSHFNIQHFHFNTLTSTLSLQHSHSTLSGAAC